MNESMMCFLISSCKRKECNAVFACSPNDAKSKVVVPSYNNYYNSCSAYPVKVMILGCEIEGEHIESRHMQIGWRIKV